MLHHEVAIVLTLDNALVNTWYHVV